MLKRGRKRPGRNKKRRTPLKERLLQRARKIARVLSTLIVVSSILGGVWVVYGELISTPYLEIKKIKVEGLRLVAKEELVGRMLAEEDKNILAFDVKRAQRIAEENPFVESASIRRILPDTLEVVVEERMPVAILMLDDGLYLVDEDGETFKRYSVEDELSLPIITGLEGLDEDALKEGLDGALKLLSMVEKTGWLTADSLSEIHVDRVKGFSMVTLGEGWRIGLGRDGFDRKFTLLTRFLEARGGDMAGIEYMNLNDHRGVVVRFATPEAIEEGGMG